ncbi:hypothetical protein RKE25_16095 [Dyella sp. BiH032]|uniref:hypothetical protein n=1 Tax=Dyella sp. BiH032 TaxID=3075430 RepID=UPI002892A4AB|nr:hypothetical protein [Dyella sp. BiH032]WNL44930.1 hypothetical protein RKE25_16095 [Dyella sp. BiH032]
MREWLGLYDRRSVGLFIVAIGCAVVFVSLAWARTGAVRGRLFALAGVACWIGGMSIGRRWKFLRWTPGQIATDFHRRGTGMGFAEKLLLQLSMVLFALSIYSDFAS